MAESIGTFDKLWLSSDNISYTQFEFLEGSSLGLSEQFLDTNGIRGTRSHASERVRRGLRQTGGSLLFNPTPAELDILLPWILGGTKSGNTIPLAESLTALYARTGRDGTFHLYDGLKVSSASFSASEGGLLQVAVQVVGIDEASSSAPAGSITDAAPYIFYDAAATVGGSSYSFRSCGVSIDNGLETRYNNSVTPSSIHAADRQVTTQLGMPYGDASALYGSALAGVAVVLTFTNGGVSLSFSMAAVQSPRQPLELGGRRARTLNWSGVARKSGSTAELVVTNDSAA